MTEIKIEMETVQSTSTTLTKTTINPTPQQSIKKQQRTLTRTAELDGDGDTDDAEVEAIVEAAMNAGGSSLGESTGNVVNASKTATQSTTDVKEEEQQSIVKANATISEGMDTAANPCTSTASSTNANATSATSNSSNSPVMLNNKKPFKAINNRNGMSSCESKDNENMPRIKDVTRNIRKSLVAGSLAEMRSKVAEKFNQGIDKLPSIHLDSDGTEIDDEEYFRTLEDNTELIAVFPGQQWLDPLDYAALSVDHERNMRRSSLETRNLRKLVGQWQQNLLNDTDLESLSNMDPNSLTDITGKELIEHIKDSDYFLQSEALRSTELSC